MELSKNYFNCLLAGNSVMNLKPYSVGIDTPYIFRMAVQFQYNPLPNIVRAVKKGSLKDAYVVFKKRSASKWTINVEDGTFVCDTITIVNNSNYDIPYRLLTKKNKYKLSGHNNATARRAWLTRRDTQYSVDFKHSDDQVIPAKKRLCFDFNRNGGSAHQYLAFGLDDEDNDILGAYIRVSNKSGTLALEDSGNSRGLSRRLVISKNEYNDIVTLN